MMKLVAALLLAAVCHAQEKTKLFETTVNVDKQAHVVAVHEGDSPASIANAFAAEHKLDQEGAQAVFYHLKQKAAQKGLIKRVLYYQPFVATIDGEKKMLNMTVYEDSDPANLAIEAGKQFGLPPNQQGQLKVAIESQVLQRVQLRIPIDLSANGIGKQMLLVHAGDDALKATLRFNDQLKDMGVTLKDTGVQSIADSVNKQLVEKAAKQKKAQDDAVAEQANSGNKQEL